MKPPIPPLRLSLLKLLTFVFAGGYWLLCRPKRKACKERSLELIKLRKEKRNG